MKLPSEWETPRSASLTTGILVNIRQWSGKTRSQESIYFYLFAAPWIIGFLAWTLGPMIISLAISFMHYEVIVPARLAGWSNYRTMLLYDPLVWQSLRVTTTYVMGAVPLNLIFAFAAASLMDQRLRGISVFRTIYYLPAVVSGIPVALLWMWIFNPRFGILNGALNLLGIQGPGWIFSTAWVIPAFILMSLWNIGGAMIIFLAGLQGIPQHLYEACELDGGGMWTKFRHVTLPLISPVTFFNLITGMIVAFQLFVEPYVMTGGGPANASLFFVLYLYQNAFQYFKMGYASALAWLLFLIIVCLTVLVFRSSALWVYYEGELKD